MKFVPTAVSVASIAIGVAAAVLPTTAASASPAVTDVNNALIASIRATAANPPRASRAMGMVNIAMFDAVNAATGLRYKARNYVGPAVWNANSEAVAISAGYTMLASLYSGRAALLNAERNTKLAALALSPARLAASTALGQTVANNLFTARINDNSAPAFAQLPYTYGNGIGDYAQTLPGAAVQPQLSGWGNVTPFVMASGSQFRAPAPPTIGSAAWIADYNQVKAIGCVGCGSPDDEASARFWEDAGGSFTPAGHWLAIANDITGSEGLSTIEAARTMAAVGAGLADAAIASWDSKYFYDTFRPTTAIRICTLETCGVEGDPTWVGKAASNTPSYTSGNGSFAGAAFASLSGIFGTSAIAFCSAPDPTSLETGTRCYDNLDDAAFEGTFSRTQAGIHFNFDNQAGFDAGSGVGSLSANIFSAAGAVPEPGTWAMLVIGFGIVGVQVRRRRLVPVTA